MINHDSANDPFHLQRFVDAQDAVFADVCAELAQGKKQSHRMWFIFPQIRGLGSSAMAQHFAMASMAEARAYLAHPLLGHRLVECTARVNAVTGRSVSEIFGYPDDLKFHSSMTLFAAAGAGGSEELFVAALAKYFAGRLDQKTLVQLGR